MGVCSEATKCEPCRQRHVYLSPLATVSGPQSRLGEGARTAPVVWRVVIVQVNPVVGRRLFSPDHVPRLMIHPSVPEFRVLVQHRWPDQRFALLGLNSDVELIEVGLPSLLHVSKTAGRKKARNEQNAPAA